MALIALQLIGLMSLSTGSPYSIFVRSIQGITVALDVQPTDTLRDLKHKIILNAILNPAAEPVDRIGIRFQGNVLGPTDFIQDSDGCYLGVFGTEERRARGLELRRPLGDHGIGADARIEMFLIPDFRVLGLLGRRFWDLYRSEEALQKLPEIKDKVYEQLSCFRGRQAVARVNVATSERTLYCIIVKSEDEKYGYVETGDFTVFRNSGTTAGLDVVGVERGGEEWNIGDLETSVDIAV